MATCQNEINSQLPIWISHVIDFFVVLFFFPRTYHDFTDSLQQILFGRELIMILKIHFSKYTTSRNEAFYHILKCNNLIRRKSVYLKSRFSCLRLRNFTYTRWFYIDPYATSLTCAAVLKGIFFILFKILETENSTPWLRGMFKTNWILS